MIAAAELKIDKEFESLCPDESLVVYGAPRDELRIEPTTQRGYFFVTRVCDGHAHGTLRGVHRSSISAAVKILGFDLRSVSAKAKASQQPAKQNWLLAPRSEDPRRVRHSRWKIYFIQADIGGPIKIGRTTSLHTRVKNFQMGCPFQLIVLATIADCDADFEIELHARFSSHRLHGEWFEPATELLEYIESIGGQR